MKMFKKMSKLAKLLVFERSPSEEKAISNIKSKV